MLTFLNKKEIKKQFFQINIFYIRVKRKKSIYTRNLNQRRDSHGLGNNIAQENGIKAKGVKSAIQVVADKPRKTDDCKPITIHPTLLKCNEKPAIQLHKHKLH